MATLNGRRASELSLTVPPSGGWTLTRARLQDGAPLAPGPVVVVIGDLTLRGTIPAGRGGLDSPSQPAVVAYGGAGWRLPLAQQGAFQSSGGVRLSTVLAALAAGAGELYDAPAEGKLGPAYGWDAGTRGAVVLAELVSRKAIPTWRVAPTGRTRFDPWPMLGAADAHGTVESRDLARGVRYVALSGSVAAWLPGATVQGTRIARVTFTEAGSETHVTTWDA